MLGVTLIHRSLSPRACLQFISLKHYHHSIRVAVVGSGPAGFYTCQKLLKNPKVEVDIYERLPVPFGLVRHGVSHHHTKVESTRNDTVQSDIKVKIPGSGRGKVRSIIELMRWHKPTGTVLALTPSLWAVSFVTPESSLVPDLETVSIFTLGAIVARGMGCTINDILDRKYDRQVERTKWRPIACSDISPQEGLVYLAVQSLVGLWVLCLNNMAVIKLGLFSGLMISSYPLFKRFTNWPQLMLAFTMNWGVLMGYAAVKGSINLNDLPVLLPIYSGSILWTLYYDTIYAHQDKTDDLFIGVKSSALVLADNTKKFLYTMSGGMALTLGTAGILTEQLWPFYLAIVSSNLFQTYQVRSLDLDNKDDCWKAFDRQKYVGFLILAGLLFSVALKHKQSENGTTILETDVNNKCPFA